MINRYADAAGKVGMGRVLDYGSRLCSWDPNVDTTQHVFYNQALNTFWNYGSRSSLTSLSLLEKSYKSFPFTFDTKTSIGNHPADRTPGPHDIIITDPPYGDAVMYEEITEFFISWFRKNPPKEFADWIWDSRRALAISGKEESFKTAMIQSFEHLTAQMNDDGLQILMFTHQSDAIWADLAQIIWASGLRVTAAWYVATETDSSLKKGGYVTGTILLVLRKRLSQASAFSDELATEIREEVAKQHETLINLNQKIKRAQERDGNLFGDADLKMAGYAAALRILTQYSEVDGKNMEREARLPRKKGETTVIDRLIKWASELADNLLVPEDLSENVWRELQPSERFYLKMLDMEAQGNASLDNYQNFAKAYRLADFKPLMASLKPNEARLKSSIEFGKSQLSNEKEFDRSHLRAILYAIWQLSKDIDGDKVIQDLSQMVEKYIPNRPLFQDIAAFLAKRLTRLREEEASHARVLKNLIKDE